jgi:hypothetical protein
VHTAARWLGMTAHAVANWQVDKDDNLLSRRVCDAILAALVRKAYHEQAFAIGPQAEAAEVFALP